MNRVYRFFLTTSISPAFAASQIQAEPPREPDPSDYEVIIDREPFGVSEQKTVKIPPPQVSLDYELQGITRMSDGYLVVIARRERPDQQLILKENSKNINGIEILRVNKDEKNFINTSVSISTPSGQQTITYNPVSLKRPYQQTETEAAEKAQDLENEKNSDSDPREGKLTPKPQIVLPPMQ
ncbi:hypothetical protein [Luteolibacter sp. AS25]|uniref:hypothetical protein n=1 Tax=Luteolibacter sp. AS25 TaxID=3135776 RepID=UPI00398B0D3F